MTCLYKEWCVSLAVSVLSKGKDYFRNVLTSYQHSMSHCQVCWQLVTTFHKTGKLCYIRFVAPRILLIWGIKCYMDSYHFIHWLTKLPTLLNGYCCAMNHYHWLCIYHDVARWVYHYVFTVSMQFVMHSILYSWGNKELLTIASVCLYISCSGSIAITQFS